MFENLTEKLERSFKILKGEGRITEINVAETLKEIRRALIDADVNYKVAQQFTDEVKQTALGQSVAQGLLPPNHQEDLYLPYYVNSHDGAGLPGRAVLQNSSQAC